MGIGLHNQNSGLDPARLASWFTAQIPPALSEQKLTDRSQKQRKSRVLLASIGPGNSLLSKL